MLVLGSVLYIQIFENKYFFHEPKKQLHTVQVQPYHCHPTRSSKIPSSMARPIQTFSCETGLVRASWGDLTETYPKYPKHNSLLERFGQRYLHTNPIYLGKFFDIYLVLPISYIFPDIWMDYSQQSGKVLHPSPTLVFFTIPSPRDSSRARGPPTHSS